ncbi:synaptosomal-associated protein 29-like [Oopsacas minuta]|uniref:Synaptosomal-associated protein 29-like n=1 Tax=Oopsacas minuta TaxID=111878 RepID=A0AAV7K6W3_9METZ|nr:synaptosomal-associated protein 29-like [Oopsacas minuta]
MSYEGYRNEAEECRIKISMYEQKMAESTARSLRHIDEAYQSGAEAGKMLDEQNEQLGNIEVNLDNIDSSCGKADRELTQIQTVFGGVVNYFKREKSTLKNSENSTQPANKEIPKLQSSVPVVARGKPEPKTVVDQNLDQIDNGLDILSEMALQLGDQIDDSNKKLDRIYDKQENVNTKVNKLNKKINRMC